MCRKNITVDWCCKWCSLKVVLSAQSSLLHTAMMMFAAAAVAVVVTSMFTKTETTIHDNLCKNFCWLKMAEIVFFLNNFVHLVHRFKWSKVWWSELMTMSDREWVKIAMIDGFETMCTNWLWGKKNSILPVYVWICSFFWGRKSFKYAWWQCCVIINCSYSKLQKNHHVTHSNL